MPRESARPEAARTIASTNHEGAVLTVEADRYRASIARVPLPVAVVTTRATDGRPVGFTASSVTSLSLSPPSLLVCVDHTTRSCDAMRECEEFSVDFLTTEHQGLARLFAKRSADKFDSPDVVPSENGGFRIANSTIHMRCQTERRFDIHDHLVVIGKVVAIAESEGSPLLISNRTFTTASEDQRWPFTPFSGGDLQ